MTGGTRAARAALLVTSALAAAGVLAGCDGATSTAHRRITRGRLVVEVSLPFTGPTRAAGEATLDGARMALAAVHGRVGRYPIAMRVLNDATKSSRGWDPGQTTSNARLAAKDTRVIGYVGDLNSGASAVSIPVLNRADVPQISPLSTAVGLTQESPEASPGEPQKYYPTKLRTFARVIPSDAVQSAVQVALQKRSGCEKGYAVYDDQVDGRDAATSFQVAAKRAGLNQLGYDQYDPTAKNYASLGAKLHKLAPDCVLISALPQDNAALVTETIARALPDAQLFATATLADPAFTDPRQGGIPVSIDPRLIITCATLSAADYPPSGRALLRAIRRRDGPGRLDAIFGYEAMALMLSAIDRASADGTEPVTRLRVLHEVMTTHDRHSVLGTYSMSRGGETSLRRFGVYRLRDGAMTFVTAMRG